MKRISEMSDEEQKELLLGYRRANQAALYAHIRTLLARSLREEKPVTGLHAFVFFEGGDHSYFSAGETPDLEFCLRALGGLQGQLIRNAVAHQIGDLKGAHTGDLFNPETGKTHCVTCDDQDPTGEHAALELRLNAQAWLGLTLDVAERFYGAYLSEKAKALIEELRVESLQSNLEVS